MIFYVILSTLLFAFLGTTWSSKPGADVVIKLLCLLMGLVGASVLINYVIR